MDIQCAVTMIARANVAGDWLETLGALQAEARDAMDFDEYRVDGSEAGMSRWGVRM